MRLFTGIDLPAEVRENLAAVIGGLRPCARLNWSPPENLHITTKFIGEWPEDRLDALVAALRSLPPGQPIGIALQGLGWFPNPRAPKIFWVGVKADGCLAALASHTDETVARLGVAPERRPFSPHLTLARIREQVPLTRLHEAVAALPSEDFGEFTASRFHLFLSQTAASGSVYSKLAEFPLAQS
jgi:RNA 2',3'-cyclic 3'-phosphodiesterase